VDSVKQQAEAIANHYLTPAATKAPAESPSYRRMTDSERLTILQLHEKGMTQSAIAQQLGRAVSSVHEVIQTYTPTKTLAKRKLAAAALRMAENVIENGGPKEHVRALEGLDVLHPKQQNTNISVQINGLVLHGVGLDRGESDGDFVDGETLSPSDRGDLHSLSAEQ
jgi:hypothetical protein